jgi:uncharacterized OB-fold protein
MTVELSPAEIAHATAEGWIPVARCGACGAEQALPGPTCFACGAARLSIHRHDGGGTLYSWTETSHAFEPQLEAELPYWVAVVRLTGGARVYARLLVEGGATVAAEMPVRLDAAATSQRGYLAFRPAA